MEQPIGQGQSCRAGFIDIEGRIQVVTAKGVTVEGIGDTTEKIFAEIVIMPLEARLDPAEAQIYQQILNWVG